MKKVPPEMVSDSDPDWLRFWAAYPLHRSKKSARRAWTKLQPSTDLVETILAALAWQVPVYHWDAEKLDFAPYPATWLNGSRWEDERPRGTNAELESETSEEYLERIGYCPHVPTCQDSEACRAKRRQP